MDLDAINQALIDFTGTIDTYMYTYVLVVLLVAVGIWFSIRTKFVQIRYIKDMFTNLVGRSAHADEDFDSELIETAATEHLEGDDATHAAYAALDDEVAPAGGDVSAYSATKPKKQRKISSFQALMVSTASRVGTGNIVGVATAIATGGPGAVFWMWLMSIIGAASAFIESTLAQIYKVRNPDGAFRGGPAYYIQQALGRRWLGIVFAVALILCFAFGFNGLQAFNMTSAIDYYITDPDYVPVVNAILGLLIVVATAAVIFGGTHRISTITSVLVPIMAVAYILVAVLTCLLNLADVPAAFALVFQNAFDFTSIGGGFAGTCVMWGIKRGLFSNEAGMGSAPNAAATADVSHPCKQGLVQSLSVYIDTLLICTASAFMMLIFFVQDPEAAATYNGITLVQMAMNNSIGPIGIHFVTAAIILFAYSSLVGNYFYAESNILFIKDNKTVLTVFRVLCLCAIMYGALNSFDLAWNLADIFMGFMAIINLVAILLLGKWALAALDDYTRQRRAGQNPVFCSDKIVGMPPTQWWHDSCPAGSNTQDFFAEGVAMKDVCAEDAPINGVTEKGTINER
jgi:AGCS family alanine or glycine:cation symporter